MGTRQPSQVFRSGRRPGLPLVPRLAVEGPLVRTLTLLRATGVSISMARVCMGELPPAEAAEVLVGALGGDILCERLPDGSWALLLIDVPGAEPVDAAGLREAVQAELCRRVGAGTVEVRLACVHHSGAEIAEPQELVAELLHLDTLDEG